MGTSNLSQQDSANQVLIWARDFLAAAEEYLRRE